MIYVSKVNINKNTARAKHIRSLIAANKLNDFSVRFLFYSYKRPLRNLNTLKILFLNSLKKRDKIYTRDIEFAFLAILLGAKAIYEIHHFGMVRNGTRFSLINKLFLLVLSKNKNIKFVTLTKSSARVLKYIYPEIVDSRIKIIPDAGGSQIHTNYKLSTQTQIKSKIVLAYAGSFMPGKGGEESIILATKLNEYRFNLAGELHKENSSHLKLSRNIQLYGYIEDKEIYNFYEASDILIAPIGRRIFLDKSLRNEITFYTSPLKLFEYSFTSKPIITIDRPCTRVFKNMPGIWFIDKNKANCSNSWRKIINDILAEKNHINGLLEERKKYLYSWEERISEMITIK